jgi:tetratricopeptide (TPR) repeat protein
MKTILSLTLIILSFLPFSASAQSNLSKESESKKNGSDQVVIDLVKVRETVADLLKEKIEILDKKTQLSDSPSDIKVLGDRIEFKIKGESTAIYFIDLAGDPIPAPYFKKNKSILSLLNFDLITGGFNNNYKRLVELRQNLILIQKDFKTKKEEANMAAFLQKIKEYRAMSVKPPLSEELRKFIVQANLFSQQKNYSKAIELYRKVIDTDAVAYPAGYSNLALLSAQVNDYNAAITYMKWYLLLEPEASDARSAQDKIYEWEAMINK